MELKPLIERLLAVAIALFAVACSRSDAVKEEPGSSRAKEQKLRELSARYSTLGTSERVQAAMKLCYVGPSCDETEVIALLDAAASDAEREALRATGRTALARQYEGVLTSEGKKPDSVSTTNEGRTLLVTGEICTRFLIENFAGSVKGKSAKLVGFRRFECSSKAMRAGVDL